jgi:DNA replication and repair protein RecF
MQITRIRLQNYRNILFVDLPLEGLTQFFVGENAQGKSNLLEAVGLLSALRSFRTQDAGTLIMQGQPEARLAFYLEDERFESTEVLVTLKRKGKEVEVDGEKLSRFRDFIGRFPVVVLSSQDIQLLRGSPGIRRQWLNLVLSSASVEYYDTLKDFHKLLNERNSLLKKSGNTSEMEVFEKMLAEKSIAIQAMRNVAVAELDKLTKTIYSIISPEEEFPEIIYKPESNASSEQDYILLFKKSRERDRLMKSTQHGPHRDDVAIRLQSKTARDFASEGQQRSMIISLKIAQLQYLAKACKVMPVLLADDVLGELDHHRKANFWQALGTSVQVIATGTEIPLSDARGEWQVFIVNSGEFSTGVNSTI